MNVSTQDAVTIAVGFGSAVLGGVISALTTVYVQKRSQEFSIKLAEEERKKISLARAFRTLVKLNEISSGIYSNKLQIDSMFKANEEADDPLDDPWAVVQPMVGADDDIERIDPEDLVFLMEAGNSNLAMEISLLEKRYKSLISSMSTYGRLREEMFLGVNFRVDGVRVAAELTEEQKAKIEPKVARLNNLIGQICEAMEHDETFSKNVVRGFAEAARKYFGANKFPDIEFVDESDDVNRAKIS